MRYHLERSADLVIRLGDGTDESHRRMQAALDDVWPYAGELFVTDAVDGRWRRPGVAPRPESLRDAWEAAVRRGAGRGDAAAARRARSSTRAASTARTPSIWASSSPRCSSCSAPTPARPGERHGRDLPTTEQVWDWLSEVPDPEIPVISVTDLGIVRDVGWEGDTLVVTVTPTYSGCPATAIINIEIEKALARKAASRRSGWNAGFRRPGRPTG